MWSNLCEFTFTQASKWKSPEESQLSWLQISPVGARMETPALLYARPLPPTCFTI